MEPVAVGLLVRSLDDINIGTVAQVHECCICFTLGEDPSNLASATWAGIYNCHHGVVSLIYVSRDPHRYPCSKHPANTPEPVRTRQGFRLGGGPSSIRPMTSARRGANASQRRSPRADGTSRSNPPVSAGPSEEER
jgi:hypothetical protein